MHTSVGCHALLQGICLTYGLNLHCRQIIYPLSHVGSPVYILLLLLFICWVLSHPLLPHGLQHTRLSCPSPSPRVCSNSCPSSRWCHPSISSSATLFASCLQSFQASGSFLVSQLLTSGSKSIGASVSVLSMNIKGWFTLGLTGLISLVSKGLLRVFSSTTV